MLKIDTQNTRSVWRSTSLLAMCFVMVLSTIFLSVPHAQAFAGSDESYPAGGEGGQQNMHVVKADGDNRPAIIFVHGGGWRVDGGTFGPDFQDRAAQRGYTSFRIQYKLMANGIDEQESEVMNAIKYVRDNAAKYNVDPNRIAIWGDSAGGSLVVRAAASGKSGAAVAVGWSAPTNGFRDIVNSWQGFVDGMDHAKCVDTSFTDVLNDLIPLFQGQEGVLQKIMSGQVPTPDEAIGLAVATLQGANIAADQLPSTFDKLQKSANEWGIDVKVSNSGSSGSSGNTGTGTTPTGNTGTTGSNGTGTTTNPTDGTSGTTTPSNGTVTPPISEKDLKNTLRTMTPEEKAKVGEAAYYVAKTSQNENLTPDQKQVVNALQLGMSDITSAQQSNIQEDDAKGSTGSTTSDGSASSVDLTKPINISASVNPQGEMLTKKIIECLGDFIKMSPALFASPRTPPMFLASAQSEYLVNPADTRQMSEKLRSMGIRSEYLILPGDRHMGYDERAEGPSFDFVGSVLHP